MKKLLTIVLVASACVVGDKNRSSDSVSVTAVPDTIGTARSSETMPPPADAPADPGAPVSTTPPTESSAPGDWVVTPRGLGPIRAGMTLAEAKAGSGGVITAGSFATECAYVQVKAPAGVMLMTNERRVARVDVTKGSVPTDKGARIGDREARIKSLYPGIAVEPHKYTDGHDLVYKPADAADSNYRIVFETDGSKVLSYRAGREPEVEYVEGCS